jgi:hypothetical protein
VFDKKGKELKDDLVLFNLKLDLTNNLQKYKIKELRAFDLKNVCDITFSTTLSKVIKDKAQKGRSL